MRSLIALFILAVIPVLVSAQDVIVAVDSSQIKSKVLEVGREEIKYRKYMNLNGPTYVFLKTEVAYVIYENGEKEWFTTHQEQSPPPQLAPSLQDSDSLEDFSSPPIDQKKLYQKGFTHGYGMENYPGAFWGTFCSTGCVPLAGAIVALVLVTNDPKMDNMYKGEYDQWQYKEGYRVGAKKKRNEKVRDGFLGGCGLFLTVFLIGVFLGG